MSVTWLFVDVLVIKDLIKHASGKKKGMTQLFVETFATVYYLPMHCSVIYNFLVVFLSYYFNL